ncbi:hypothetical protein WDW86_07355 [Bdellovibrionota bacterium FG-2]
MKFPILFVSVALYFSPVAHAVQVGDPASPGGTNRASFSWIHKNIIMPKCAMCHTTTEGDGDGLGSANFDDYNGVLKLIKIGDPEGSRIYVAVKNKVMPKQMEGMPAAEPLNEDELRAISDWITLGAPNDCSASIR